MYQYRILCMHYGLIKSHLQNTFVSERGEERIIGLTMCSSPSVNNFSTRIVVLIFTCSDFSESVSDLVSALWRSFFDFRGIFLNNWERRR